MSVSGVGGGSSWMPQSAGKKQAGQNMPSDPINAAETPSATGGTSNVMNTAPTKSDDPTQQFLDYMKESPAERMLDAWLGQQGMTKEQFDALPPAEQQKLLAKMREEIELKMKESLNKAAGKATDILV